MRIKIVRLLGALSFGLGWVLILMTTLGPAPPLTLAARPISDISPTGKSPHGPMATCTVDDDGGADYTTVQDAVDDATCTTINVAAGEYVENVVITRNLTLVGAGTDADDTWIGYQGRVFSIEDDDAEVTISNVVIHGVYDTQEGTGVYNEGTLTLTHVLVDGNESAGNGGGIANDGTLTVLSSTVSGGLAEYGGGIYHCAPSTSKTLTVLNSTISDNHADHGGGVYICNNRPAALEDSVIGENSADYTGGGIANYGTLTLNGCQVLTNTASEPGLASGRGAGLWNNGEVVVTDSVIRGNASGYYGGGIYVSFDGTLSLEDSTVTANSATDNGGGIMGDASGSSKAEITVHNCEISANTASYGGGLNNNGVLIVENSTIISNTAETHGGGIRQTGTLSLTNVTLSGNATTGSGGGIYMAGTTADLDSVTLANNTADADGNDNGNGGGFYLASGTAEVKNTLIGENYDDSPTTVHPDCSGSFTTHGYNLIRDNTGCSGLVSVYDQWGTSSAPLEPYLTPLGDYGGDTLVHALRYDSTTPSPAVDAGPTTDYPGTDQRGVTRPVDRDGDGTAQCDTGAVEMRFEEPTDLVITKTAAPDAVDPGDAVTYTLTFSNAGALVATDVTVTDTLPNHVINTSFIKSGVAITKVTGTRYVWQVQDLEPGDQGTLTIYGTLADTLPGNAVNNTASIAGAAPDLRPDDNTASTTIPLYQCFATPDDGATVYRSADAQALRDAIDAAGDGDTVKVAGTCAGVDSDERVIKIDKDLTLRGGYNEDDWDTSDPDNPTTLDAQGEGRVVYVRSSTVAMEDLRITGGSASSNGGGVYVFGSSTALSITGVEIVSNTAKYSGGGLYVYSGSVELEETDIISNTTQYDDGAGIYLSSSTVTLTDTHIVSNTAGDDGGGAYVRTGATMNVTGGRIVGNTAGDDGGGIYGGGVILSETQILSNTASDASYAYGGGLYVDDEMTLMGGEIRGNRANRGGGVYVDDETDVFTQTGGSTITDNVAEWYGGGVYVDDGSAFVDDGHIQGNTAYLGGGVYVKDGAVTLNRVGVTGNTADRGGGLYNNAGTLTVTNVTLGDNEATTLEGGGLYNDGGTSVLTFATVAHNQSTSGGSGLHNAVTHTLRLQNTLVADNDATNCSGAITSDGYNLEDGETCGFSATSDQQSTNPWLEPLQDNGGDTLTYALQPGSPAIDAGLCVAGITTDQRGEPRPHSGSAACDVGAYEADVDAGTDVTLTKTAAPLVAAPGDLITYALTFSNDSAVIARNLILTDALPTALVDTGVVSSGVALTHVHGTRYVWIASSLASGASGIVTVTGAVKVPLAAGSLTNTATLTTTTPDGVPDNNRASVSITVRNVPPVVSDTTVPSKSEELPFTVRLSADDDNGDALTYAILTHPVSGTAALADPAVGEFVYTPTNRTATYTATLTILVTDTGALTDTATVTLTILADDDPPTLSNIQNQKTIVGTPVGPLAFTLDDVDTPIAALTLDKASSNPTLVPLANIAFGGSGAHRTVTVTPTAGMTGTPAITVSANDGTSTGIDVFTLAVGATVNSPPEFVSEPVVAATEDIAYTYDITTADLDPGDPLTITALATPLWLTLADHGGGTATLGGLPINNDVGDHTVRLQVEDGAGATAIQHFTVTVANTNDPPLARNDLAHTNEDTPKSVAVLINDDDLDGDPLSIAAIGLPDVGSAVISGSADSAVVVYTPVNLTATYTATFPYTLTDGALTDVGVIRVHVEANDDPPTISNIPNRQTYAGVPVGPIPFILDDPDTAFNALTLGKASSDPALVPVSNITFGGSGANRTVTVTPTAGLAGTAFITVTVSDGTSSDIDVFALVVSTNHPPAFASTPVTTATEGVMYTYHITATDLDPGDALTITAPVKPSWLILIDNYDRTAVLRGRPGNEEVGEHPVSLRVRDNAGEVGSQSFVLTVANVNNPPLARSDHGATDEETPISVDVLANDDDLDGDSLFIQSVGQPNAGRAVVCGSTIVYTPANRATSYSGVFTYTISDGELAATAPVIIEVTADDDPPEISDIPNHPAEAGVPVGPIPFTVGDPDTPPGLLTLDKATSNAALVPLERIAFGGAGNHRTVTLTPTAGLSGTSHITVTVNDGTTATYDTFILAVDANSPPEFTSEPVLSATVGVTYTYPITVTDVDAGDALTLTAPALPAWLTLTQVSSRTATLTGVPVAANAYTVELEATDGEVTATQTFTLTVTKTNSPPEFTSEPVLSATVGVTYTYPITVTDVDAGDALTLTAPALPAWLTLTQVSSRTATLTGVPVAANAYTVELEVTDGKVTATQPFTVTVSDLPNQAPMADAGPDQTVDINKDVTLDGSESHDPDGHLPLAYGWTQTGGPAVTLSDHSALSPTFTAPGSTTCLTFTLTVTDALGLASAPDTVVITVSETAHSVFLPLVIQSP